MASKIKAISAFAPRLKLKQTVGNRELIRYIADRTGLNRGEIQMALSELSDAVKFFNRQGQGVKLENLGTYLPKIRLDGQISVSHRLDKDISSALNIPGDFTGEIINRENIGKSSDELIAMWNGLNPEDPVS